MQQKYKQTTLSVSVHLENESPIFGENAVSVKLTDEAGGIFLELTNHENDSEFRVDYEQWVELNKAVTGLMKQKCEGM
jgi:hypothetical protein